MPFIKKTDSRGFQPTVDTRKIFIGREGELLFFVQNILRPEEPTFNIISIFGQGGVGKSTLLARYRDEARAPEFKDYCLAALVDERQTSPASIMERFANQLHLGGDFEKTLKRYKDTLRKLQIEQETMQTTILQKVPDFAGAAIEGVPIIGPILREGVKVTTGHLLDKFQAAQIYKEAGYLEDPLDELTKSFVDELNYLAYTQVILSSKWIKREHHILLFFDTFEQMASETVPWLLNYLLDAHISSNIVLVIAGRDHIYHSTSDGPKRWLPHFDSNTIFSLSLNGFTEDETSAYLAARGITDSNRIATIWQLSRGLPLYLGLLTSNPEGKVDPTKDVVDNFLRWIPEHEQIKRRLALDAALLSKPFNQDDLEAFTYLPEDERLNLYYWLIGLSFVQSQEGRFRYHELAQDLFSRHLYQRSRKQYYTTRRDLANYYQRLLEETQIEKGKEIYQLSEWLELTLALAYQLFLVDEVGSIKAIEQVLNAYQHANSERNGEITKFLRELSEKQSNIHINTSAQQSAKQLLQYIESDVRSQEHMMAATTLIERVIGVPLFSTVLLAHLYNHRGWTYLHLKEYQQAIHDFDGAIELHPEDAWTYGSRGLTYRLLQNFQKAIEDFDHALELNPQYAWAYGSRGLTYRLLKEYQQAISDFSRAIELNPQYGWAYGSRGLTYYLLREYQQAIADFDSALELNPQYAWAYAQRGRVYINLKEYQQAIADFDHAIKFDAKFTMAYIQRGIAYMILKDFQQALSNFDYALQLDPRNASIFAHRGMTYLWMRNIKQAAIDYVHSWEIDVNYIGYGWMAEWSRMCQEIFDLKFTERLEAIAAVDPQHYLAYVCRGVALWQHECFMESLAELDQAISSNPKRRDSYFWRGMVCALLRKDEEAMAMIEKALELELPPVLLAPLRWLEEDRPVFYQKFVRPLFVRYELTV